MTRVTAPDVSPVTSDNLPAVVAPMSMSSSSVSMSDSDRPKRTATVWPRNDPWMFTRLSDLRTASTFFRSMVDNGS